MQSRLDIRMIFGGLAFLDGGGDGGMGVEVELGGRGALTKSNVVTSHLI